MTDGTETADEAEQSARCSGSRLGRVRCACSSRLLRPLRPRPPAFTPSRSPSASTPASTRRRSTAQLWGVALVDEKGALLYGRNQRQLFIPASNTKLVVAAVASALLPPDWTVRTSLYAAGRSVGGVLQGDLVLYGRGDPTFGKPLLRAPTPSPKAPARPTRSPACASWPTASARAASARSAATWWATAATSSRPLVHPDWEAFDLNWWYAAPVSGLGFNDNSVDFTWSPGTAAGAPAVITMSPDLGDVVFENRTVTVPAGGRSDIGDRFFREPGTLNVWAEGTVALDQPPQHRVVRDAGSRTCIAARALRQVLQQAGIAITGTTRSTTDSTAATGRPGRPPPLAEVTSRPLRDWIFPILNPSQNWFAEMLLKQLGRQFGRAGSWPEGLAVERRFLIDSVRVDSTEFSLGDGSGLSSGNLMSPLAFTQILRFIRAHPRARTFLAGLPQAGGVGSLRSRFVGHAARGPGAARRTAASAA